MAGWVAWAIWVCDPTSHTAKIPEARSFGPLSCCHDIQKKSQASQLRTTRLFSRQATLRGASCSNFRSRSRLVSTDSLAGAERRAIDLKQGMKAEEVERLLGEPKRTALRQAGLSRTVDAPTGSLQWTYTWFSATEREGTLEVVFAHKSAGEWVVDNWGRDAAY